MFNISAGKGFQMTFANGWTVSVQFGSGNYCGNRTYMVVETEKGESTDAEIAAWDASGTWYDFGSDTVKGWCSPDEVAAFITLVQSFPTVH
jgi:hypothetical protein